MELETIDSRAASGAVTARPAASAAPPRTDPSVRPRRARPAVRVCAAAGALAVTTCLVALVVLDVLPADDDINPISQPVSSYALTADGALFDWAIVAAAAGLAAIMTALILDRRIDRVLAVALATTAVSLIAVVIFPDLTTGHGLTPTGRAHWTASMIAFGVMPIVPLRLYRLHRGHAGCLRVSRLCGRSAAVALGCFAMLFVGNVIAFATALPLWRVGGLVERVLVGTELISAGIVALWAWRGCTCARG